MYAVFREVDHEGAKALLPVAVDGEGEPKGYDAKSRREAIKRAVEAGDTKVEDKPFRAIPVRSLGKPENPGATTNLTW